MLIAHEGNSAICAHCGRALPGTGDAGSVSGVFPKGIMLNLSDCERNVVLCGSCRDEKGESFKGPDWYPCLSEAAKERLRRSLRIAERQLKKRRRHMRNTGENDTDAYRRMGDLLSDMHMWHE